MGDEAAMIAAIWSKIRSKVLGGYREVDPADLPKVAPAGYRLAVLNLPFSRKFALTWWIDENGKLGRKSEPQQKESGSELI